MEEVDKGLVPAVGSLNDILGDVSGRVEDNYKATRTWRTALKETTDGLMAQVGPYGDVIAGVGGMASGLLFAFPAIMSVVKGMNVMKVVMIGSGIGILLLAIGAAVAAYITWKDEIHAFLRTAWNVFMDAVSAGIDFLRPLADLIGIELPENMDAYKVAMDDAAEATTEATDTARDAAPEYESLTGFISGAAAETAELTVEMGYLAGAIPAPLAGIGLVNVALRKQREYLNMSRSAVTNLSQEFPPFMLDAARQTDELSQATDNSVTSTTRWELAISGVSAEFGSAAGQALAMFQAVDDNGDRVFSNMELKAGVFGAALSVIGNEIGGVTGELLNDASGIAMAFATGGPIMAGIQAALVGVKWIVKGIKKLFTIGAPDEAQLERRDVFANFHADAVKELSGVESYNQMVADHVADGWDRTLAETASAFSHWGQKAGLSHDESMAYYKQFQDAVKSGNVDQMNSVIAMYNGWKESAREASDVAITAAEDAKEANIAALEESKAAALAAIDMEIEAYTALEAVVMAGIDAEIAATETRRDLALAAIDDQIAKTKELMGMRLAAQDALISKAEGAVVDTAATEGAATRLGVDLVSAVGYGTQQASERILALAADVALLQKAGVSVQSGISEEFDAEIRGAVAAAQEFGITIPDELRGVVSSFTDIDYALVLFGDGLTEQTRRLAELHQERIFIEEDFEQRLGELAGVRIDTEARFESEIAELHIVRLEAEAEFAHGLNELKERRATVEAQFIAAIAAAGSSISAAAARASMPAAPARQQSSAVPIHVEVIIPRDAVTDVVLEESPSSLAWRGA